MRAILLDWILDVHQSLGFRPPTLYRTAYILDHVRFAFRYAEYVCLPVYFSCLDCFTYLPY
jgi:hypothetical protein